MNKSFSAFGLVLVIVVGVLAFSSMFIVQETEKVIVLQFGKLVKIYDTAGLKFKLPFIQNVIYYDKRLQGYNLPQIEVSAGDQKRIVVNLYARFVIDDPYLFYKTIGVGDPRMIEARLSAIVGEGMRTILGRYPMLDLLSQKRAEIMTQIFEMVKTASLKFGVIIQDVRIVRADLPAENSEAVYRRMESDRVRIAKRIRATGQEKAQKIRAEAEKERTVIMAKAQEESEKLRGHGDAEAIKIYAKAFNHDPKFFDFYRSMQAYEVAMNGENTTMVLSPDSNFFKYFTAGVE